MRVSVSKAKVTERPKKPSSGRRLINFGATLMFPKFIHLGNYHDVDWNKFKPNEYVACEYDRQKKASSIEDKGVNARELPEVSETIRSLYPGLFVPPTKGAVEASTSSPIAQTLHSSKLAKRVEELAKDKKGGNWYDPQDLLEILPHKNWPSKEKFLGNANIDKFPIFMLFWLEAYLPQLTSGESLEHARKCISNFRHNIQLAIIQQEFGLSQVLGILLHAGLAKDSLTNFRGKTPYTHEPANQLESTTELVFKNLFGVNNPFEKPSFISPITDENPLFFLVYNDKEGKDFLEKLYTLKNKSNAQSRDESSGESSGHDEVDWDEVDWNEVHTFKVLKKRVDAWILGNV